jgi:hypothetical protein
MGRKLTSYNGEDKIYTPDTLSLSIVKTLNPSGIILEPCSGGGSFLRAFASEGLNYEYDEIEQNRDFLNRKETKANWLITNPPFSKIMKFLKKSIELGIPNIAFLCTINVIWMNGKLELLRKNGYSLEKIYLVESPYFRKCEGWRQSGFSLGVLVITKTDKEVPVSETIETGVIEW